MTIHQLRLQFDKSFFAILKDLVKLEAMEEHHVPYGDVLREMEEHLTAHEAMQERANGREFDANEIEASYGAQVERIHNYEQICKVLDLFVAKQPVTGRKLTRDQYNNYRWQKA